MKTDKPLNPPNSSAQQIVCHWTGGSYIPSALDRHHYHFLVDGEGMVRRGEFTIDANARCVPGEYAAHVRGWNPHTIGLAVCCMHEAQEKPFDPGKYPIRRSQWDTLVELAATLCLHYGIPITERTVLMHSEVEPTIGIPQRGKWDINVVPMNDKGRVMVLPPHEAGDAFRANVQAAYAKLTAPPATESRGVTAADIIALRDELTAQFFNAFEPLLNKLK